MNIRGLDCLGMLNGFFSIVNITVWSVVVESSDIEAMKGEPGQWRASYNLNTDSILLRISSPKLRVV